MNQHNERLHFVCRIIDDGEDFYSIWYTDESDGVATKDGNVALWKNEAKARDYARQQQWPMDPNAPATFDLDYITLIEANPSVFRPKDSLDIWNLFSDIARSLDHMEFSRRDSIASNLHARLSAISLSHILDSEQAHFTTTEIEEIVAVLRLGKAMLKERCLVLV